MKVKQWYVWLIITGCIYFVIGDVRSQDTTGNWQMNLAESRLEVALQDYKLIERRGGWPVVPAGKEIGIGDTSSRVKILRKRLALTKDLKEENSRDNFFDHKVSLALKKFQKRHNIPVTGKLDKLTLRYLNIPVSEKIRVMQKTLDSWENFPDEPGEEYILINIPEFTLRVFENNYEVMQLPVIVGDQRINTTPQMSDEITHIVLNPYWNIPQGIARTEILPYAETDSIDLDAQNYEIVSHFGPDAKIYPNNAKNRKKVYDGFLKLREKPSSKNPLGDIKFMFPNKHAVYLHGTPKIGLFDTTRRAFSHGCIRVKNPRLLASWLTRDMKEWPSQRINEKLDNDEQVKIILNKPVPIHIVYWLTYVEEDGTVKFLDDIYNYI